MVPDVFSKVLEVKKLLALYSKMSVNEAVSKIGISRSAYYKYKDSVFPFYEMSAGRIITMLFAVQDVPGILSEILSKISASNANILTIHQNLPINSIADITITLELTESTSDINMILDSIAGIDGVKRHEILSGS